MSHFLEIRLKFTQNDKMVNLLTLHNVFCEIILYILSYIYYLIYILYKFGIYLVLVTRSGFARIPSGRIQFDNE